MGSNAAGGSLRPSVAYSPKRLMRSLMYGERSATAAGVTGQPSWASWRRTAVMSRAVWKITQLASSVLNLMIFSCSAGSLRSIASWPKRSQVEKPW